MRYYVIINPPEYRDNDDDESGFAWAGEAADDAAAVEAAICDCEDLNGWPRGEVDRDDTSVIECGPDYRFMVEEIRKLLPQVKASTPGDGNWLILERVAQLVIA